jgi:hypothetical protein
MHRRVPELCDTTPLILMILGYVGYLITFTQGNYVGHSSRFILAFFDILVM